MEGGVFGGYGTNTALPGQITGCYNIIKNKSKIVNFQEFKCYEIIRKIHNIDNQELKDKNKLKIPTITGDFRRYGPPNLSEP